MLLDVGFCSVLELISMDGVPQACCLLSIWEKIHYILAFWN